MAPIADVDAQVGVGSQGHADRGRLPGRSAPRRAWMSGAGRYRAVGPLGGVLGGRWWVARWAGALAGCVPPAVVGAAPEAAVVLGGGAADAPARTWSPWHRWAGTKQVSWRSGGGRRRGAAQGSAERPGGADVADAVGAVGHDPLDERVVEGQQVGDRAGGDDGARDGLANAAGQGVEVDHHGHQRRGALPVGGSGHGPGGHLDEGVVAALGAAASQVGHGRGVAVDGLGGGPVGVEQVTFDPFQRALDGGGGGGR